MFRIIVAAPVFSAITACAAIVSPDTLIMDVGPNRVPCMAEGPRNCLVVRQGSDTAWTYFYDPIEGFAHEAGFRYRLKVERSVVERPPADGSSFRYRLLEILTKEVAPRDSVAKP